jgi:cell division protein FtsZ
VDADDVRSILADGESPVTGTGVGTGERRAIEATETALANLAVHAPIAEVRRVLLDVRAGSQLELDELYEAADAVARALGGENAFIVTGCEVDETMGDEVAVTLVAGARWS